MTLLGLVPYRPDDVPFPHSVPVSVVVLAKNEAANIGRCLDSLAWAEQVVVVDSSSSDATIEIAERHGAEVVCEPWRGFAGQREFSLRLDLIRHPWVYFVDADEWVTTELAREVARAVMNNNHAAYRQRYRLVFQGRWIRHCGWYSGSWIVRLMRRDSAQYSGASYGERPSITGSVGTFRNDIVDEDLKGLATWLRKHVEYAVLESERRGSRRPVMERLRRWPQMRRDDTRSLSRAALKDLVYPSVPAKPLALFFYMYVVRLGFLDGVVGLRFCLFHAWFELSVGALRAQPHSP